MPALTQKGQITIPKKIRRYLRVERGDEINFEIENDQVVVKKIPQKAQFEKYIGYLKNKNGQTSDEIVENLRDGL
jgi:AbrB family looped-hinge helix DNA binding protein